MFNMDTQSCYTLQRFTKPEEIAHLAVYVLSRISVSINGQT
jgi:enoyl-[acyl-carrier-protein] reductase (NADH)